ncbi:GNAT family N-acetyltransferase, partial [Flavobacterium sp. LBUM151]
MKLQIQELTTIKEMLQQIDTMRFLYPNLSIEKYEAYLSQMVPHNYIQIGVFEDGMCLGITGCW